MESLRFRGRPVRWFGVGAPADIDAGIAALQAAVSQNTSGTVTNPGGAVAALLAAGTAAVGAVGPAIDALSGNSPDVMGATHLAWVDNDKLSRVNSGPAATQDDVTTAKNLVLDMINQYQVAERLAKTKSPAATPRALGPAPKGSAPATTPPASDIPVPHPFLDWIATNKTAVTVGGAVVAGGVLLGAVAAAARRRAA